MMTSLSLNKISIVHWYPDLEKNKCGYCKNENCSVSDGMWAEQLTVEDYQNLIDRGWRRSGKYCYKPVMHETCCPMYTIRCEALKFQPSKSQRKIIKRFNRFLSDGINDNKSDISTTCNHESGESSSLEFVLRQKPNEVDFSKFENQIVKSSDEREIFQSRLEDKNVMTSGQSETVIKPSVTSNENVIPENLRTEVGPDPNRPPCKKAKLIRLEKKQQKMKEKGINFVKTNSQNLPKSLEELLENIPENSKHKLKIVLVSVSNPGEDWNKSSGNEFEIYRKYQMAIHNDPPEKCTMEGFLRFLVNTPLKVVLKVLFNRVKVTMSKRLEIEIISKKHNHFKTEAALFEKYQKIIHNEDSSECGEDQFFEFLVDSPLEFVRFRGENGIVNFGSYHQQYWIDDKLIAVGVIDILPKCISSVYFFYDPDYRFLSLGTYASLREISFIKSLHQKIQSLQYYYMGYYIHTCPKMRYKGRLNNSFLLCPETYKWFPIEQCLPKLEANKYSRLNDDIDAIDEDLCTDSDVDKMKILLGYSFTFYRKYKQAVGENEDLKNAARLVGRNCIDKLLFVSSRG